MTTTHYAGAFGNEIGKGLRQLLSGGRELAIQMLTFPVFYLLVVLFMGRGRLLPELLLPTLLGMVALTFIHEQVNRVFWSYQGDIQSGVLEQTYLTPLPSVVVVLGRQVAAAVSALPTAAAVLAAGYLAVTVNDGGFPVTAGVLVPLAAIAVGTAGLSLVICGLTLVYQRIEIIPQVSVAVYAVAGGTLVPLTAMPDWTATAARLLVPIAPGVEAMRDMVIGGDPLTALGSGWGLGWLLLQPILILVIGVVLFARLERVAKKRGTLGRY
ncbi:ABC transporter permease [Phytomonospora endophytica]|uniref:ABC-type polysaccharide/polyol phosphate export permease n=1 Tax=Phytomonospora endophytica TaxID=714109 RepID=A0A841FRC5_9ACTN|nr:ABC transporter permease [Phytomonospora endophytica]MBB6036102.1 ABC-type polysaccharide/polyol phosphate export permease [Phytomonospora endophytica]GIG67005.1 hypothetical protein Pen01_33000 [Phytomonospora endophytica]